MKTIVYGISTGESGNYGIGDIVTGRRDNVSSTEDGLYLDGEEVFNVFIVKDGKIDNLRA